MNKKPLVILGGALTCAVFLALLLGFFFWQQSKDKRIGREKEQEKEQHAKQEREKRKVMREQRLVYEKWYAADLREKAAKKRLEKAKNPTSGKPDEVKVQEIEIEILEYLKEKNEAETEAYKRWRKDVSEFKDFPGSRNNYYHEFADY